MIVAIEGASAAGKTTWCRSHAPEWHVPEAPQEIAAPDLFAGPTEVGRFWVNHAIENWRKALAIEKDRGVAFCDGDPFHLYYSWALWQSGAFLRDLFEVESAFYRNAFAKREIGFVDHVLWLEIPIEELRRRAKADSTRRRKRHEVHLALVPWMKLWFQERECVLPGTVNVLAESTSIKELRALSHERYDVRLMETMIERLTPGTGAVPEGLAH